MGQAKLRGNRDARMTEAKQRLEALKPDHIVCNNCQAKLTEIFTLDTHGMKGIEVAFSANCSTCNHDTWAVLGDPKRRAEHDAWIAEQEGKSSHRDQTAPPPTGAGTTYTYTYTKPSHSWAKGTQRKAAPSPDVGQKRAASTASPIEQHSAEHRKSPHRNPLVRLNVWLGTANGRTYAIATVVGLVFIVWLLPGVVDRIERSKGSRSSPPQQQPVPP